MRRNKYPDKLRDKAGEIENTFRKSVGKKISIARKNKGWSLDDLSRETGLSKSTLADIESGKIDMPLSRLAVLGYVLDMRDDRLISEVFKILAEYGNNNPLCSYKTDDDLITYSFQTYMNVMNIYAEKKTDMGNNKGDRKYLPPTKGDDDFFEAYINRDENQQKKEFLLYVYRLVEGTGRMPDRELQTIARAACRFVIDDTDAVIRRRLKEYYHKRKG